MSITMRVKDLEAELNKTEGAIIINELANDTDVDRAYIEAISSTRLNKDEKISTVPMCGCKKTKLGINLGVICEHCGTEVTMNASNLKNELWMIAPKGVTSLILPKFAVMLMREMQFKKNYNGFEYILNPSHKPPRGQDKKTRLFRQLFMCAELPRGVNSVIANMDLLLDKLEQFKGKSMAPLRAYVAKYGNALYPRVLPLPSRLTLLVEDTHVYTYYDKAIDKVLDSIYTVAGIGKEREQKVIESRMASAMISLAQYHLHMVDNNIGGKPGVFRKMIMGSRLSNSIRTILTSIHGDHDYRCPKIPKSLACIMLRPAIMAKMVDRGMTLVEAYDHVKGHLTKPSDTMVAILYELVEDTKPVMEEITGRDDMYGLVLNLTRWTMVFKTINSPRI